MDYTIALAGNPNSGKTSIFNALTGSRQHVGNWPGVTVERKEGTVRYLGNNIKVIDLPGIYTLSACSEDEFIAVNYILKEKPDAVINVVDSGNLERNLYLTLQLLEMNTKVILALNMADEAEKKNIFIDKDKLAGYLGIPVVPTVAVKKTGISELLDKAVSLKIENVASFQVDYGPVANEEIAEIVKVLGKINFSGETAGVLAAVKLLEGDRYFRDTFNPDKYPELKERIEKGRKRILKETGFEPEIYLADKRYQCILKLIYNCVRKEGADTDDLTERIDRVLTNKWLGIPLFFLIMFLLYQITMSFGNDFLGGYLEEGFAALGGYLDGVMVNSPTLLRSFVIDAVIGGFGSVLVFIPLMLTMYFLISFLEDSGYMARAAYVMDRLMNAVGLHGKTAVAMIISSGCNVTGIMSTRALDTKKDRMIGILISPFVSCSARLPVYALFAGAFFGEQKWGILTVSGLVFFSLYLLGIIIAVIAGKVLSKTLFKTEKSYFVMEMPPYRLPGLKSVLIHMWEKTGSFVKKAGTVIFAVVVIIWTLSVFPLGVEAGSAQSILGRIGSVLAPLLSPAGFGTWEAAVSLIVGIGAKEAIVATFGTVYSAGEGIELAAALKQYFTPLSAYAFMVMTLLYAPCAATLGVIKKETNSAKWALFALFYSLAIGWTAAVLIYQAGRLIGMN